MLTRATFAVMLKFSRLAELFQCAVDSIDVANISEVKQSQDEECFKCITTMVE